MKLNYFKSVIFSRRMMRYSRPLILAVLTLFLLCSVLPLNASEDAHAPETHSSEGHGGHSVEKDAHHGGGGHTGGGSSGYESRVISSNILPFLVVLIPILIVFALPFVEEKKGLEVAAYGNLLSFLVNLLMIPYIWNGQILQFALGGEEFVINMAFFADSLSFLVGIIANFVWMIVSFYSIEYMSHEKNIKRYNIFSMLSLVGMLGVVYTRNLFSLYIFFEILSICSYVMVIHEETEDALKAGLKYVTLGIGGGLLLFACFVLVYTTRGSVDILELSRMSAAGLEHSSLMPFLVLGMILGFGVKAGMFPVHIWLPDAHPQAPAPASALLSGIMIKAGGYGIIRVIYNIAGVDFMRHSYVIYLILLFSFINIFLGSAMAIRSTEIKQMLAYSSISQIGYVLMGVTVLTEVGIAGGILHIFNHAMMKATLFMCAGAFIHQTGLRELSELKGIGKKMPIISICFTMAAMSMVGLPPFSGFISKWFLALGALDVADAGSYGIWVGIFALVILVVSSFMNLLYYGPIIYGAWFKQREVDEVAEVVESVEPTMTMWVPVLVLASGILIFGLFPQFPLHFARDFSTLVFH